jgi:N-acetylglucosamine-6-phosphate deacetylase
VTAPEAPFALVGARIFDGERFHDDRALVLAEGRVAAIVALADAPAAREALDGMLLAPGFVDWQVNGGGGALFNAEPTPEGIARIAASHARFGVTAMTPTLITDAPAVQRAAADAVAAALAARTPGVVGAHFEGPHIAVARKGAHEAAHIRPPDPSDLRLLTRRDMGRVVVTLAPETAHVDAVAALSRAGVRVSLGHSDADYDAAMAAFHAGARAATHLFNAMSGPDKRAPGLVGAALDSPGVAVGLIADGWHVHPAMLRLALRARPGGLATLVSDAMPTAAGGPDAFDLGGRRVTRRAGRLTLEDGTLAGSDLTLDAAMRFAVDRLDAPLDEALRMASTYPARLLGLPGRGQLTPGARADIVALDNTLRPAQVWVGGRGVDPNA